MAKQTKGVPTKAEMIRQGLKDHADKMPLALAAVLNSKSKEKGYGLSFNAGEISTYKSKTRADAVIGAGVESAKAAAPTVEPKAPARSSANGSISGSIQQLLSAVDSLGADEAKRIIDVLGSLKK